MNVAPSIDTVCQAIQTLYHNPDTANKERASVWLGELQRSVFAWEIADQLLHQKRDLESSYFAAQTMRTKIQCAFHELPISAHQSLRDSLLSHISSVSTETSPIIVTQLCLALADLALQMASWKNASVDLIQMFGSNMHHIPALLEILNVLPEEVNSRPLRLGSNRRAELLEEFKQCSPLVLQLLNVCSVNFSQDLRIYAKVFRCLGSWLNASAISSSDMAQSKLLMTVFECLLNSDTPSGVHEAASDCISSAMVLVEGLEKHMALAQVLFQSAHALPDAYHMSVAKEDVDKAVNYCRVFTELGESFVEIIINTPNEGFGSFQTLDLLVTCVGHHDYEVAEITFNFWYRLSELLYKKNNDKLNEMFKPYVERLISALCRHCQMEPDYEGILEDGDFMEFRTKVSDLIKDIVFIVGSSHCFLQMFEMLKNPSNSWDISESALFVMCAVAKNILPDESEIVPQVVQAILQLPENIHVAVHYTSTLLLGELSEWIDAHPQVLEPILNFLLSCLRQPKLAPAAANSLQNICATCKNQMIGHFSGLLQIVQAVDNFNISNEAALGLLKGTALILANMPLEKISEGLKELCMTQIAPLARLLKEDANAIMAKPGSKEDSRSDPAVWLDRLATIFRHTNPVVRNGQLHPCQPVIQEQIWPVLSETCTKYQADVRIIERCCRCIRFAVRCVGKQSAALLHPLVTQMVTLYQVYPHSCFLYLGSILVDEYGTESGCTQGLLDMLQAFWVPTCKILDEQNGLRNHPDTVDDLFRLCTRFLQRIPIPFLQCPIIKDIMRCSLAACTLDHRDANSSVMKYFNDLVRCAHIHDEDDNFLLRQTLVQALLLEHGQLLIQNLINACVFCLPSFLVPDIADVFFELMLVDRPAVCRWLEITLKALPTQSSGGLITATHKQLTDFHKAITSAENGKTVSIALRDFARLFR